MILSVTVWYRILQQGFIEQIGISMNIKSP